jgi:uncharacterized protein YndB with AHSA1/START domain
MADIIHEFTVRTGPPRVFHAVATPQGMTHWWTQSSRGKAEAGGEYQLHFGADYTWRACVTRYEPETAFELEMIEAHPDWVSTRVGCELQPEGRESTRVLFYHSGWPHENQHWRMSCYCWAMYLRVMRRYLEYGDSIPYSQRLDA